MANERHNVLTSINDTKESTLPLMFDHNSKYQISSFMHGLELTPVSCFNFHSLVQSNLDSDITGNYTII